MNPTQLLDEAGTLSFGLTDGQATDVVLACALLHGERGSAVRTLNLEHIGSRLGVPGLQAVLQLLEGGHLSQLRSVNLNSCEWLSKRQLVAIIQAIERGKAPIEELNLGGTNLCVSGLGLHATDGLEVVCRLMHNSKLRVVDLHGTHLCGSSHDPANSYTLSGLLMLCEALGHPDCVVEELHLSQCGIKAESEEAQPSSLPPSVYGITMQDTEALASLHPKVRAQLLKYFDYPNIFRPAAQRKGLTLPPLEVLGRMEATELSKLWEQVMVAHAQHDSSEGAHDAVAHASPEQWRNYERGFPSLRLPAVGGVHSSLMAKHLTRELYDQLKDARTAGGLTLHDVIRPGVRLPSHPVGCLAGDVECYDKFPALFDAVILEWHGWNRLQGPPHRSDLEPTRLELPPDWAEEIGPYLHAVRIEARRNFADSPFTPSLDAAGRAGIERGGAALFELLNSTSELRGTYHALSSLSVRRLDTPTHARSSANLSHPRSATHISSTPHLCVA